VGFPRALQLSRILVASKDAVAATVQQLFGLSPTQTRILLELLRHPLLLRSASDLHDSLDVHVCRIRRRLTPFNDPLWTLTP
jgi:DNA-binding MarR family transcriptional regulator